MSYRLLDRKEDGVVISNKKLSWKVEYKIWGKIVGTMSIFILCRVGMDLTDVIFLGHLGNLELEAASTASI